MKLKTTSAFLMTALFALTGCDSIGDGNTIESLEVVPANFATQRPYAMYECLRDQLIVVATFTDGTKADFSERSAWTTDRPDLMAVSNGDIPLVLTSGPQFVTTPGLSYRAGTLVPKAPGTATVTATFASLTSSIAVTVGTSAFKVAPIMTGVDPLAAPVLRHVGPATTLGFRMFYQQPDGLVAFPSALNPLVWRIDGGVTSSDGISHVHPDATNPKIKVATSFGSGLVQGLESGATEYTVQAVNSVCEGALGFTPTATVRVVPFAATDTAAVPPRYPITLAYEDNYTSGGTTSGNQFAGTEQLLKVLANLDATGDGLADQQLEISGQVDLDLVHTTACDIAVDASCVCDADGLNCVKQLVFNDANRLFMLVNNDGEDLTINACFTDIDGAHDDDCEEHELGDDTALFSNPLPLHVVPVDFASGTLSVAPASVTEQAFTYPGTQFEAYATMTALPGFTFADGDTDSSNNPTQGTTKVTRYMTWTAFTAGSTTAYSTIAYVRNFDDGFLGRYGTAAYAANVATSTPFDIYVAPLEPFNNLPATTVPAVLTVTPHP